MPESKERGHATLRARQLRLVLVLAVCALAASGCGSSDSIPKQGPVSAAERAKLLSAERQNQLEILHLDYPDVKPGSIRVKQFVEPRDWAVTVSACVNKAGFHTTVDDGGGVAWQNIPTQQQETYELAYYTCYVEYPINPSDSAPLSVAEMKYLYGYETGWLTRCLRKHGVEVSNPPSEQSFADAYATSGGWTPYADVTNTVGRRWAELNRQCPDPPRGFRGN